MTGGRNTTGVSTSMNRTTGRVEILERARSSGILISGMNRTTGRVEISGG